MRSESLRSTNLVNHRVKQKRSPIHYKKNHFSDIVYAVNMELIERLTFKIESKKRNLMTPIVRSIVEERKFHIPGVPLDTLVDKILDAITGYGILHPFVVNENITDIKVMAYNSVLIHENFRWRKVSVQFESPSELQKYMSMIARKLQGQFTMANPLTSIEDDEYNLRIRMAGFDVSPDSPQLTIRRLSKKPLSKEEIRYSMSSSLEDFLKICIKANLNVGITGAFRSGKTTLLGTLINWIDYSKSIGLIQSANEIQAVHPFLSRRKTRESVGERGKKILEQDLLHFAKQESYDILCIGEFLDEAAYVMLHVLQQGIMSMFTYHANDPQGAINSYIHMVQMAKDSPYSNEELVQQAAKYNDIMIIMDRLRVREIVQFTGEVKDMKPVFETLWTFDVNSETNFELKGDWRKVNGSRICEKLRHKAALNGVVIPEGF